MAEPKKNKKPLLKQYTVTLINDDHNSFENVIFALLETFPQLSRTQCQNIAMTVHEEGKCDVAVAHLELAETFKVWLEKFGLTVQMEVVK
jgi:ATP-dependent Clp protease adapter protein ClpS